MLPQVLLYPPQRTLDLSVRSRILELDEHATVFDLWRKGERPEVVCLSVGEKAFQRGEEFVLSEEGPIVTDTTVKD